MVTIYIKQIRKNWFSWSLISLIVAAFSLLMVLIWPQFEPFVADLEALLDLPFYQGFIGEGLPLTTVEGLLAMELFILSDIFFMGLILLFGVQCIPREVHSGSLDFMLSFPVPRWRFLLEKLAAFITVTFSYPVLTLVGAILGAMIIPGIEFQTNGLLAFFLALVARWTLYITITALVILISIVFMDSGKTLIFGGLLLGGSWILDVLGGIIGTVPDLKATADTVQSMSLYYYLDGPLIMKNILDEGFTGFPLFEFLLILAIGAAALHMSLLIFDNPFGHSKFPFTQRRIPFAQKREFK